MLTIVVGWGLASWLLLGHASNATATLRKRSRLISLIHLSVTVLQFALTGFLIFVLFNRSYEDLTWTANIITSITATAILVLFSTKFLQWYRSHTRNRVLLFYSLAALSLSVTIATDYGAKQAFLVIIEEPTDPGAVPAETYPIRDTEQGRVIKKDIGPEITTTYLVPSQYVDAYHYLHQLPSTASFIFSWAATAIALRYYIRTTGRVTFWFLIIIILALYVIGRTPPILDNFEGTPEIPRWTNYVYMAALLGGNVMFGVAFIMMARQIDVIRDHLYMVAIGFTIIGFAHVSNALQPTFGVASHSLVMLSSYLFSVGMYVSAVSISEDTKLRQLIKKSAREDLELLEGIGRAQVEQDVWRKTVVISKAQQALDANEIGIKPSLKDEEMKSYLELVIKEMHLKKTVRPS